MPGWALALGVAVVLVLLLDRAVARGWFDHVHLTVRSPRHESGGAPSGFLGDLVELFQPNRVNLTEEQQRQEMDIVREGDNAGRHPSGPRDNQPTVP